MKMPKSGNHMVDLPQPDEPYCEHDASITEILSDDTVLLTCYSCGETQKQLVEWID